MISKQKIKTIHSLAHKKFRDQTSLFIGEGPKVVEELLHTFQCTYIAATAEWLTSNRVLLSPDVETEVVTPDELTKASLQRTPQQVIAIFRKKIFQLHELNIDNPQCSIVLTLDTIQDPGNLGTILRIASWFGILAIVCSPDTADIYSPKVVQATMGAIGKTPVIYTPLPQFLDSVPEGVTVYGTLLDSNSENIYEAPLTTGGIIVMGNEGNGISPEVRAHLHRSLYIPHFPTNTTPAIESLNVGIATAITCAEFRRRSNKPNK